MATPKKATAANPATETTTPADAAPAVKKPRAAKKVSAAPVEASEPPTTSVATKAATKKVAAKKTAAPAKEASKPPAPAASPIVTTLAPRAAWPFPTATKP